MPTTAVPAWTRSGDSLALTLANGVTLDFALAGDRLLGLRQATVDGLRLIAPDSLRAPCLETRDGWLAESFRLAEVRREGDDLVLDTEVLGVRPPLGRKLDMFQFPFIGTPQRRPVPLGRLSWRIGAATVALGHAAGRQHSYRGFSYRFEFELNHPCHWLLDAGTWELGGNPEGVTLLSQHMHPAAGPLEFRVSRQGPAYTTAEAFVPKTANHMTTVPQAPGDPSWGYILPIQAQVRGAGGALVDVQFRDDALLIGYLEQSGYYRTLVEWRPENPGIGQLEHHFFPLTTRHVTAAKTILAARAPGLTRVQALNRWTDAWEHVATAWRAQAGVARRDPPITFSMTYITHEPCWGAPPEDFFARMESQLDWMQANGFTCLYTGHWGGHRGLDMPESANACEPDDYLVHPRYGRPEVLRRLCDAAHARGIKVSMWICLHLSLRGPTLKAHPDWVVKHDSAAPWDGNYRCLAACSLRSGFRGWLLEQLRQLRELGLDMVFFDSYNNLSASPIDFRDPSLTPQFPELMALQGDIQKLGLDMIIETVGPIGVTSCGLWPQYLATPELGYWTHYRCLAKSFADGTLTPEICFRLLANKAPVGGINSHFHSDRPQPPPQVPGFLSAFNRLYRDLAPLMQVRTLCEDGSIVWHAPDAADSLVFVPGTGSLTVPAGEVAQPLYGGAGPLGEGCHQVTGLAAYRLSPRRN